MKNHHKHPTGAAPLPEVHSVQEKKKLKGSNSGDPKNKHEKQNFNKKQKSNHKGKPGGDAKDKNDTKCHRCGTFNHFAKDCRTPKHFVVLYQKSLNDAARSKDKAPRYEAHFNLAPVVTKEVGCSDNNDNLDLMKEKLPSTDDILLEFTSNDMFGDLE
jgi:hypothetical protein